MAKNIVEDTEFTEVKDGNKNSTTVDADDLKQKDKSKIRVDFINDEDASEDFLKRRTKEKDSSSSNNEGTKDRTQEELNDERKKAEERKFSEKDFKIFAEFIIGALDAGIATFCKYYADDTSDTAYSITQTKKDLLTEQLTLILSKYFQYLKIEYIFIFSLVICYSGPVIKARKLRKAKKVYKRNNDQKKEKKEEQKKRSGEQVSDAEVELEFDKEGNEIKKEEPEFREPGRTMSKRGAGGPGKG